MKKKIILLAPHPDDGEFSCGATIKKLTEKGAEIFYCAFSPCTKSVPEGFSKGVLFTELKNSCNHLGIKKENIITYDIPVREFPKYRQAILEEMVLLKKKINPDLVLLPNSFDFHQDHEVIHNEGVRAFKHASILGYELPWNYHKFKNNYFSKIEDKHIEAKINAVKEYKSQGFREYASSEFFYSLARVRGVQISSQFAEAFECIRWVD